VPSPFCESAILNARSGKQCLQFSISSDQKSPFDESSLGARLEQVRREPCAINTPRASTMIDFPTGFARQQIESVIKFDAQFIDQGDV